MRHLAAALLAVALVLAAAAPALADGLPIGNVEIGPAGVELPGGELRLVALNSSEGTVVAAVRRDGGEVAKWTSIRAHYTIPAVALDGSPGGLTRDGTRMVLIRPRAAFPQRSTRLAVLDTEKLRIADRIHLRGDFSFDALSPDGRTLYLIEYTSRRDPTRYLVRAYDLEAKRLRPKPIVDPREDPDEMRGFALTRADSPDGRWAYTLYDGGGEHPFIHALDTVAARAVCIDLHDLEGQPIEELSRLRLRFVDGGAAVHVTRDDEPLIRVDAASFEVSPSEPPARPAPAKPREEDQVGVAWPLTVGATLSLAAVGGWLRRRRR